MKSQVSLLLMSLVIGIACGATVDEAGLMKLMKKYLSVLKTKDTAKKNIGTFTTLFEGLDSAEANQYAESGPPPGTFDDNFLRQPLEVKDVERIKYNIIDLAQDVARILDLDDGAMSELLTAELFTETDKLQGHYNETLTKAVLLLYRGAISGTSTDSSLDENGCHVGDNPGKRNLECVIGKLFLVNKAIEMAVTQLYSHIFDGQIEGLTWCDDVYMYLNSINWDADLMTDEGAGEAIAKSANCSVNNIRTLISEIKSATPPNGPLPQILRHIAFMLVVEGEVSAFFEGVGDSLYVAFSDYGGSGSGSGSGSGYGYGTRSGNVRSLLDPKLQGRKVNKFSRSMLTNLGAKAHYALMAQAKKSISY